MQTPYELIRLNTIQVILGRRVARSQFFYTIRGLLKTFYGFYPTTVSFEVAFEDFIPNRLSDGVSPIQLKKRACDAHLQRDRFISVVLLEQCGRIPVCGASYALRDAR